MKCLHCEINVSDISTEAEEWRLVPLAHQYAVSSLGRVRRVAANIGGGGSRRPMKPVAKPRVNAGGYLVVCLSVNGLHQRHLVHRLVAAAFLPPPLPGQSVVCHRDDGPKNNVPSNLFWGTHADNVRDKVSKGRHPRGERSPVAKLKLSDVMQIRCAVAAGESQRAVAKRFGISQPNVSLIASGKGWANP